LNKSRQIAATLAVAALAMGASIAIAQTADDATLSEIVVTGSRVITNGDNSPTPVTVVQAQELLALQPTTISDALNLLPVFSGPRNQTSNPNPGAATVGGGGNAASNQLNLRNLGAARTLILFDGHRVSPTTANGIVDVDMIPQLIIQRVDVVTGGASAVYGSDAVSGVVNFITDRKFNGMKASLQGGQSSKSDGRQYEAGVAYGADLGGKAHFVVSYEHRNDDGVLYRSSRPATALSTIQGAGSAASPFFIANNTHLSNFTFGGLIRSGFYTGQQFASNGLLSAFVPGASTGNAAVPTQLGGDGAYYDGSLKSPLRSDQLFGRLDYEFSPATHGYVEVAGNRKHNEFFANWPTLNNVVLSRDNGFLPAAYRNQMITSGQTTFNYGKFLRSAPRLNPGIDERQLFANAGLEGELGNGYKWDVGLVHSDASLKVTNNYNLNNLRLWAALDSVINPATNQVVCNVTLTNPTAFPGCVPINVFGPTSESAESIAYILGPTHFKADTTQDDVSGSISGAPLSSWAGPVNMALSAEWRKQSYEANSDATPSDPANLINCAAIGLVRNCTAGASVWQSTYANRSTVSQTVREGAVEFDAPLVNNHRFIQSLNLNGAVRYTNYTTSGSYTTWKAGLDWHLNDSFRIRATRSRDIRAPTLDDLFTPTTTATGGNATDSLLARQVTAPNTTKGNPDLKAETGDTTTVGVVYRPNSVPGFSLAVDGFDIKVGNAITLIQGTNFTYQTACYTSGGTSQFCAFQTRALGNFSTNPLNVVTEFFNYPINLAEVHTWGADVEANYATRLREHPLMLRTLLTYQPHINYVSPGAPTLDMGGIAYGANGLQASPVWRATAFARIGVTERFSVDLLERWRSALGITADPTQFTTGPGSAAFYTTNLNLTYQFKQGLADIDLLLNVQNLFNKIPPAANFPGTQQNPGQFGGFPIGDDPVGRYYSFGLRLKF
jgi:outer membrane receptor protein involved in Fe transport